MFLIWRYILLSPNEIYLNLHCLRKILHYVNIIPVMLDIIFSHVWTLLKTSICFEFRGFTPSAISSSDKEFCNGVWNYRKIVCFCVFLTIFVEIFCSWCFINLNLAFWFLFINQFLFRLWKKLINLINILLKLYFLYIYNILDSFLLQFVLIRFWKTWEQSFFIS